MDFDARAAEGEPAANAAAAPSGIYRLLRLALAATAVLLALWLLKGVLTVVFAAALLAVVLHGLARLLHRWTRLPFGVSLALVVLILLGLLAGFVLLAGPGLVDQAVKLRQALGQQTSGLHDRLQGSHLGRVVLQQIPASLGGSGGGGNGGGGQQGGSLPSGLASSLLGFVGSAFGLAGTLVVVVMAALYFAAAPGTYANGTLRLVAQPYRAEARKLMLAAGSALWAWSAGQALDMLVVGLLTGLGLWLIGVPLAFVLGTIAGLANFVPYIGAITGAIPAALIAFSVSSTTGLETVALVALVQGFEGNVLAPLIQKRAVELPPGLTILSQTAFGAILGLPGLIFATPLTAALVAVMGQATKPLDKADRV